MIRGSSRTSESSNDRGGRRSVWLAALLFYSLAAGGDFAYHLSNLRSGNRATEASQIPVAFSAALFWPVDLIAMWLLAAR